MAQRFFPAASPESGLLDSKGLELIWAEPMIVGLINKDTVLYFNPPLFAKNEYTQTQDHDQTFFVLNKQIADQKFILQDSHKLMPSAHILKNGTKILYRDAVVRDPVTNTISISPHAVEVAIYEPKKSEESDLPEAGRDVNIIRRGYLFKKHVKETSEEYYLKTNEYIFPANQKLSTTAVNQTIFGDCFLLSTLMSLLAAGGCEKYFRAMMHQNKDSGLVYVKLFNPKKHTPVCLVVRDSIFCEGKDTTMQHEQLWIHMLEKAYAGYGMKLDNDGIVYSHASFHAIYGPGGHAEVAFQILTGKNANSINIDPIDENEQQPFTTELLTVVMQYALNKNSPTSGIFKSCAKSMGNFYEKHEQVQLLFQKQFLNLIHLANIITCLTEKFPEKYAELITLFDTLTKLEQRAQLDDIQKLICFFEGLKINFANSNVESKDIKSLDIFINCATQYIHHSHIYSLDANRGAYSNTAFGHFKTIAQALLNNQTITAATLAEFPEKVPGLRANHAYAVLDVKQENINGTDHYFIKMRNPWGHVGRVYTWDSSKISSQENKAYAEFWLELNDFYRYFKSYKIGEPVPGLILENALGARNLALSSNATTSKFQLGKLYGSD